MLSCASSPHRSCPSARAPGGMGRWEMDCRTAAGTPARHGCLLSPTVQVSASVSRGLWQCPPSRGPRAPTALRITWRDRGPGRAPSTGEVQRQAPDEAHRRREGAHAPASSRLQPPQPSSRAEAAGVAVGAAAAQGSRPPRPAHLGGGTRPGRGQPALGTRHVCDGGGGARLPAETREGYCTEAVSLAGQSRCRRGRALPASPANHWGKTIPAPPPSPPPSHPSPTTDGWERRDLVGSTTAGLFYEPWWTHSAWARLGRCWSAKNTIRKSAPAEDNPARVGTPAPTRGGRGGGRGGGRPHRLATLATGAEGSRPTRKCLGHAPPKKACGWRARSPPDQWKPTVWMGCRWCPAPAGAFQGC